MLQYLITQGTNSIPSQEMSQQEIKLALEAYDGSIGAADDRPVLRYEDSSAAPVYHV